MKTPLNLIALTALFAGTVLAPVTLPAVPAHAADAPAAKAEVRRYDPSVTSVVVLPVIDATGEKVAERRKRQENVGYKNAVEQFRKHGFAVVDDAKVKQALQDCSVDLSDEESYRRENFYNVAKKAGGDLVMFVLIQETLTDTKKSIWKDDELQGRARVKMWLLDAKNEAPIFSAIVKEGKAAGVSKLFAFNEGTDRRANAVGNAVKEQLEGFFKNNVAAPGERVGASVPPVPPSPAPAARPDEAVAPVPAPTPVNAPSGPAAPSTPAKSVFILADGSAVVGTLVRFDGMSYTVAVDGGAQRVLAVSDVKSVNPVK